MEWCSKQSENLPRKGRITQMNHFSNCKRFPLAGSLRMEVTRKVCLEWEARDDSQKAFNTMLRVNLEDDRKATKSV